jgi:hypothetical protein
MGPQVAKPGDTVQIARSASSTSTTGTTILPFDNTIPQITEGDEYLSRAITPTSAINVLQVETEVLGANNGATLAMAVALFQDATANALSATGQRYSGASNLTRFSIKHAMAAGTTSATTFRVRMGGASAGTTTFNGEAGAGLFGGVANSFLQINEVMV